MLSDKIIDWYFVEHKDDVDIWSAMDWNATWNDLLNNIPNVYDYLNIYDSLAREFIFNELSERAGIDYDTIYNKWLNQ